MTQKEYQTSLGLARIVLAFLIIVSVLSLTLSALGIYDTQVGPVQDSSIPGNQIEAGETRPTRPANAESSVQAVQAGGLQDLLITRDSPSVAQGNGLRSWPGKSSIENIYDDPTDGLAGRVKGSQALAGITVIIDPGHGGQDSGSIYPAEAQDPYLMEKTITMDVALQMEAQLRALGATVILTRLGDEWRSVYYRIALASQYTLDQFIAGLPGRGRNASAVSHLPPLLRQVMVINNDTASSGGRGLFNGLGTSGDQRLLMDISYQFPQILFISLHCNSLSQDETVSGTQVYYQSSGQAYVTLSQMAQDQDPMANAPVYSLYRDGQRQRLASIIQSAIVSQIPDLQYAGDAVQDGDYAILRELNLTSVMVELGFISNAADRQILTSPANQATLAEGIASAVYRFFCEK